MKRFAIIGTITGTILSVAAVGTLLGVKDIPRPAWSNEVILLAANLIDLDNRVTTQQLYALKLRYYQNQREQAAYKDATVPNYLLDEQTLLEQHIKELEHRLDKLRDGE